MRRRGRVWDGPPPPERLLSYRTENWPVRARRDDDPLIVGIRRYKAWLAARRAWEAETGRQLPRTWERTAV